MSTLIQEKNINGVVVAEHQCKSQNLTYVNNKMVTTDWDETVLVLERGETITYESQSVAMGRVLGACRIHG